MQVQAPQRSTTTRSLLTQAALANPDALDGTGKRSGAGGAQAVGSAGALGALRGNDDARAAWVQQREKVRRAWVLVALGICAMIIAGSAAAYWKGASWGPPLVLGSTSCALLTIALLGTWRTKCAVRRVVPSRRA